MNKAKAIFAAGVIVVVSGASAGMWYLNEKGYFGEEQTSAIYEDYEENDGQYDNDDIPENDAVYNENEDDGSEDKVTEDAQENVASDEKSDYTEEDYGEFLSVFTKAYFYENGREYRADSYSDYELIRFAWAHINRTDNEALILEEKDDSIRYYYKVSREKVNAVLEKYLGTTVPAESVYTENDNAFFKFEDSYFYAPAADGLPYINTAEVETVSYEDGVATVTFTVYSADEKYARGEARILTDDGMKLEYYKIKQ